MLTWTAPWAWAGLVTLGVPVAIHWLARHRGPRTLFPTLRFFDRTPVASVRLRRLNDLPLLAVRATLVALIVAALAGPTLMRAPTPISSSGNPDVAIVVDTSASMSRRSGNGRLASEVAHDAATAIARAGEITTEIDIEDLRAGIASGLAWLDTEPGPRELAVVSDFQRGAISAADLRNVPAGTGIRLERIEAVSPDVLRAPAIWREDAAGHGVVDEPRVTLTAAETRVATDSRPLDQIAQLAIAPRLAMIAGADEQAGASAALSAILSLGSFAGSPEKPVAVVYPHAGARPDMLMHATPIDRPWMSDVVREIGADETLARAARDASAPTIASLPQAHLTSLAYDAAGQPLVIAGAGDIDHVHRLWLFVSGDPASLVSTALLSSALHATSGAAAERELEPMAIDPADLRKWDRTPTPQLAPPAPPTATPIARWVWLAVLALLALETWMRRAPQTEVAFDHAA